MAYPDMTRCPQTEAEFRDYFYALIQRSLGATATEWEAVMSAAYPWGDDRLPIPEGVGPGIKQQPGAPFFGLTQQYSGGPKGRIFLPSDTPDELGYYTRCEQYLDDAAQTYSKSLKQVTPQSTGLVWAWYLAGPANAYAPIQGPESGGGTTPPPTSGLTEEQVQAMIDEAIAPLAAQLAQPLRAHGPINLPIVFESLHSLRCKGDIDVDVVPGQATPPPDTSSDPSDLATVVMLKKLVARRNEPDEGS